MEKEFQRWTTRGRPVLLLPSCVRIPYAGRPLSHSAALATPVPSSTSQAYEQAAMVFPIGRNGNTVAPVGKRHGASGAESRNYRQYLRLR